jgi:hypothetical protein
LENSAGTVVFRVDQDGSFRATSLANVNAYANANLTPGTTGWVLGSSSNTTNIPLKIQNSNAGTVTGDLTQWLSNTSTVLAKVDASGNISTTGKVIGGGVDLVYVGSASGASAFGLPAGTLTSSYKYYKIIYEITNTNTNITFSGAVTSSGTAASTNYLGVAGALTTSGSTGVSSSASSWSFSPGTTYRTEHIITIELMNPALAQATYCTATYFYSNPGVTAGSVLFGGTNTNATAYDGFQLSPSAGTITGTVKVYGYHN